MRYIRTTIPLVFALCLAPSFAHAQSGLDVFFGAGTASASSSNQLIDPLSLGTSFTTPRLGGVFGEVGADYMIRPSFVIGAETDFRFSQGAYTELNYRPTFYDFNGIWAPRLRGSKRVVPELEAGLGVAHIGFYLPSSYCDQLVGCSSSNTFIERSNHFQVHLSAGVRLYATSHLFIRPQVDAHWINNFFQFGQSWVPEYGAAPGWSFGEH